MHGSIAWHKTFWTILKQAQLQYASMWILKNQNSFELLIRVEQASRMCRGRANVNLQSMFAMDIILFDLHMQCSYIIFLVF